MDSPHPQRAALTAERSDVTTNPVANVVGVLRLRWKQGASIEPSQRSMMEPFHKIKK